MRFWGAGLVDQATGFLPQLQAADSQHENRKGLTQYARRQELSQIASQEASENGTSRDDQSQFHIDGHMAGMANVASKTLP